MQRPARRASAPLHGRVIAASGFQVTGKWLKSSAAICGIADDSGDCFSEKSRCMFRKDWLIRKLRNHTEAVFPWNIARGEDSVNAGMRSPVGFQIAERKFRAVMRRTHDAKQQ